MTRLGKLLLAAAGVALGLSAAPAFAQEKFPSKPIRIVVPYAPGGATDYAARLVSEKAKASLGVNIIIENKPGAHGIISIEEMARAKPDGYTLMIGNVTTNCITPVLFADKMSINYDKDVVAVARLLVTPNVFLVNAGFPAKDFKEFIDYTKKNAGKVRYASSGIASFPHFDTELLSKRAGIEMVHIPYKGGAGEMVKGIVNGDVNVTLLSTPITLPQVKAGTVRAIANIKRRLPQFPDLPTLEELGYPGVGTENWSAVFAPAGTPMEVQKILHKAFSEAAKDPFVVEATAKTGTFVFTADSIEETQKWLRDEMAKWRGITQEVKIEMN
ncbi:MAG TPA: tripartite tricarboxylate transporter substrate binding protein [Xanthobacteraceae bacterium]|nr:tripartite tricarboxylate transporter substrate binding protein [Xanthobacteraceae bacterium]